MGAEATRAASLASRVEKEAAENGRRPRSDEAATGPASRAGRRTLSWLPSQPELALQLPSMPVSLVG